MQILFLLTQDMQSPSGLGRYGPMAKELARLGNSVEIAAVHPDYQQLTSFSTQTDGLKISYVAPMHVQKRDSVKQYYRTSQLLKITALSTYRLTQAALSSPADIIVIGKPHPMNGMAGWITKVIRRKTVCVDCDDYEAASNRFSGRWQRAGIQFFEDRVPKLAKLVTTNTHFMRDRLIASGLPSQQILYVPNGVDRERFKQPDQGQVENLRKSLGLLGKKVVLYIGSLSLLSHPVDLLMQAFHKLKPEFPNSALVLVGGGEDLTRLQTMAHEMGMASDVVFCGRVPPIEIPLYYKLGDVSVDPVFDDDTARSRCPLKLFESWATAVPFVTADVGDRRFLAGEPLAALLASAGDPDSLAHEIREVLINPDLAVNLRKAGQSRVENYWWDVLVNNLALRYAQLVKPKII